MGAKAGSGRCHARTGQSPRVGGAHRVADDDGRCDFGGENFSDGCDNHVDLDDNGVCDVEDCNEFYDDGCDIHRDADDDGKCDMCGLPFSDGCDIHRDADDDYKCDKCGEGFDDGVDVVSCPHRDADDNGKCDFCGEAFEDGLENSTSGLEFELNADGESYTVVGIGNCTETDIFISGYNGLPVVAIGEVAFYNCTSLTSVTIGDSVTVIGGDAFLNCPSLTSVTIGDSVTGIGDFAFCNCPALRA